jgi:hypothetical protein
VPEALKRVGDDAVVRWLDSLFGSDVAIRAEASATPQHEDFFATGNPARRF